jgi:hypothetical protein
LITTQHTQESLSVACIQAFAGKAGVNLNLNATHDYGVDGIIKEVQIVDNMRLESGFHIDFQLKSTIGWKLEEDCVVYKMNASAYNKLIRDPKFPACVLILLCLPAQEDTWLNSTEESIVLKNCCYWHIISGPKTENNSSLNIRIPRMQLLTPDAVRSIVATEKARLLEGDT